MEARRDAGEEGRAPSVLGALLRAPLAVAELLAPDHMLEPRRVLASLVAETGSVARFDETIAVPASAGEPLQGASQRFGRLVGPLPEARSRGSS